MSLRRFGGTALLAGLLAACADTGIQTQGYYHAPQKAYSLPLNSHAFRGQVTLTEGCDQKGGSLNVWDAQNRFFRIDYLRINHNDLATVPPFAADRTIAQIIFANYLRKVIPSSSNIKIVEQKQKSFVRVRSADGLFALVSLQMQPTAVPELYDLDHIYYYGFLIFKKGDLAYVVQHRFPTYQPDRIRAQLQTIAGDLVIPGTPPSGEADKIVDRANEVMGRAVQSISNYAIGTGGPADLAACTWTTGT